MASRPPRCPLAPCRPPLPWSPSLMSVNLEGCGTFTADTSPDKRRASVNMNHAWGHQQKWQPCHPSPNPSPHFLPSLFKSLFIKARTSFCFSFDAVLVLEVVFTDYALVENPSLFISHCIYSPPIYLSDHSESDSQFRALKCSHSGINVH